MFRILYKSPSLWCLPPVNVEDGQVVIRLEKRGASIGGHGVMIEAFPVMTAISRRSDGGEMSNKRK